MAQGWTVTLNARASDKSDGSMSATASYEDASGKNDLHLFGQYSHRRDKQDRFC